jgi:hypothetical protein
MLYMRLLRFARNDPKKKNAVDRDIILTVTL